MIINWDKIWESFDKWFDKDPKDYTWETQQKKLQQIIDRQLKKKK